LPPCRATAIFGEMRYSLGAIGVVLLLAASGCSISDTDDGPGLIRDAKSRYATLPTFPGATETSHSTTVAMAVETAAAR